MCSSDLNDERIAELVPEDGLTPLEVAALDIPAEDRLWVLLREEVIPARELRLLACDWAEAACCDACWNDERSLNAIAVARRFAVGEVSAAELAEAESRSVSAASASAARSAWSLAASAAWSAAALPAARAAARAARAVRTARTEPLADVVRVLKG